jgi:subtilisin family serine protease
MRKIIVLKPREWLRDGFLSRSAVSATAELKRQIALPGVDFRSMIPPLRIAIGRARRDPHAAQDIVRSPDPAVPHRYVMTADVESDQAADQLIALHPDIVEGVFEDPQIQPFPVQCPTAAIGTAVDVVAATNIATVHAAGSKGRGVRIIVVDTGIDGTMVNVSGGTTLFPGAAPGTAAPDHGTMVAMDALITAPDAMIYDYPLLQSQGGMWVGFLSDAIRAYAEILTMMLQTPGAYVVTNSWGLYDRSQDAPAANPQNYSRNPKHPFNLIVGTVVAAGADVLFAAGNCGQTCPDGRCGAGDIGPAQSIHGANSHPDVFSVGAITTRKDLLGYSSQGPGLLAADKPDITAPSHFQHSGIYAADSGTSAACPVLAGVVASLRSNTAGRTVSSARMKDVIRLTADPMGRAPGWDRDTGWGVVDASAALASLP